MRHRKKGRRLGRSSSHRRAMLRNLASALFLTERPAEFDENPPKVKGRIVTTLHKAKEVRPLVERCITIARRSLPHSEAADQYESDAQRGTEQWKAWRSSDQWQKWNEARAPVVTAQRRALRLLGDKEAVSILFDEIAPRFVDRDGGYTRILKLAKPRLGDAGDRAILEFVGRHDRVVQRSESPTFEQDEDQATQEAVDASESEPEEEIPRENASEAGQGDGSNDATAVSEDEAAEDDKEKSE